MASVDRIGLPGAETGFRRAGGTRTGAKAWPGATIATVALTLFDRLA
jgi:hypothetical protein